MAVQIIWNHQLSDNSKLITDGITGLRYRGIITDNDGYWGYNTHFTVDNSTTYYHVHFKAGGTQVTAINCFGINAPETNLVRVAVVPTPGPNDPIPVFPNFTRLQNDTAGFQNTARLMAAFGSLVASLPKGPNNQLT